MATPPKHKQLGLYLRQARKRKGLSKTRLAMELGAHHTSIAMIEDGQVQKPKPETLEGLADALDVDLAELYLLAGYKIPAVQPDISSFLHVQHRHLPKKEIERIADLVEDEITDTLRRTKKKR